MKSASISRGFVLGLLVLQFALALVRAAAAGEDAIKIGILHSLSGTMAISEAVLKDTVLDADNRPEQEGRAARPEAGAGRRRSGVPIGMSLQRKPGNCSRRKRLRSCSAAGLPPRANPYCRSSRS